MGSQAAADALHDAGLSYNDLQAAVASYCYGDPTCGQRALYGTLQLHILWLNDCLKHCFLLSLLQNLVGQVFGCMYI